ncbi:MAG: glycosyltransferase family 4 protein [Gemmatimonadetes bacterium]|nr:glycosyltransferase family 4 protein [Gemmatimonadota bacterium]
MKVLYVSKALVVAAYRDKIAALGRHVDVRAVIPERWGREPVEASPEGVPEPERVPVRMPGHNHLHLYRGAGRWIDAASPDLVHVDEEPYSLVTLQMAGLCRRRGLPWLFFTWQNLERRPPPPFGAVRSAVLRGARGALAGTDGAGRALRSAGWKGPMAVIPQFGVCPRRFAPDAQARRSTRARLAVPPDAFLVGYGGRLVAEKGVHVLLDAFAKLSAGPGDGERPAAPADGADGEAAHLVLIGDGPERSRLEEHAARAGVADRVRFTGPVPSTAMPGTLAALDVLVLPTLGTASWTEQFGRVLVEAMACGIPVVGSLCGEIPSVIGDAGDLVPMEDAASLAEALRRLRDDAPLRRRRAEAGRRRVTERFTQERVAERTVEFYRSLVGGGGVG